MSKQSKEKNAMKFYKGALKDIITHMGKDNTTYEGELKRMGNTLFGNKFHGVYAANEIPVITKMKPYCIANLDERGESGSHWVALVRVNGKEVMFYDSFGRKQTQLLPKLKIKGKRIVDTDRDKEQKIIEDNCGQRCLAFLAVYDTFGRNHAILI